MRKELFQHAIDELTGTTLNLITSRGASAIYVALKCYSKSGQILIPSTICLSPIIASRLAGYRVRFVGIEKFQVNLEEMAKCLRENNEINAILLPELYGYPLEGLDLFWNSIKNLNILVIEDLAQSGGRSRLEGYTGKPTVVTIYSFGPAKIINSIRCGVLSTRNDSFFNEARFIHNQIEKSDSNEFREALEQYNSSYEDFLSIPEVNQNWRDFYMKAADFPSILYIPKLDWLDNGVNVDLSLARETEMRNRRHLEFLTLLSSFSAVNLPSILSTSWPIWRTTIRVPQGERDKIVQNLRSKGFPVSTWYKAMHLVFKDGESENSGPLEEAALFQDEVINLFLDLPNFDTYLESVTQTFGERLAYRDE